MAKGNGWTTSPRKDAHPVRLLKMNELSILCGGSAALMGQALNGAWGKKDLSKFVLGKILGRGRGKILKQIDENAATRILQAIVRWREIELGTFKDAPTACRMTTRLPA